MSVGLSRLSQRSMNVGLPSRERSYSPTITFDEIGHLRTFNYYKLTWLTAKVVV